MDKDTGSIASLDRQLDRTWQAFVVAVLTALVLAWPVMLAFGILHHRWAAVPAWSYWETYVLCVSLNVLRGTRRS